VALLAFAVAFGLTRLLWPIKEEGIFILFLAAVMLSAWYGGARPGLLTAALSALAVTFTFLPPRYSLAVAGLGTWLRLVEFLLVAALVVALNEAHRSARRRAEAARAEAEAASRAKDDFLAMVSHDLRAPLSAILGWTELARREGFDAESRSRALDVIERNALAQRQLIDDLLDVARITSGTLRLDALPLEFSRVVGAAADSVRPAAEAKGLRLEVRLDSGGVLISGDGGRLEQVVLNLLSNAIKFTPEGGRVEVRLDATPTEACLAVSDTGRGIEPEFLPHIFERFRQGDGDGKLTRRGLGLGLAIVRHIVERHGGTVRAESRGRDEGSTFTVRLPLVGPQASAKAEEAGRHTPTVAR
jgi:signal transduction histidine kinase